MTGHPFLQRGFFQRIDESEDARFYDFPRKVTHLDDAAVAAVTRCYEELLPPVADVLDLMSSWRSHLPATPGRLGNVMGLGMNEEEMQDNPALDTVVVSDLNADPTLPFEDESFDAVTCCVSVQYMVRPLQIFAEVARVLRPSAPFIVTFSNRCFPPKAIRGWLSSGNDEHVAIVRAYFEETPAFNPPSFQDHSPVFGDPVFAIWSQRRVESSAPLT